jgi:hypothetical protein
MDAITQPLQLAIVTPEQALPTSPATMRAPTLTLDPYTDEACAGRPARSKECKSPPVKV